MTTLLVPPLDPEPWPTLGPEIVQFIEATWVYGPGDLKGQPYKVAPDFEAWLYRAYEIHPEGHEYEGSRRFKRVVISERKGTAKTEKAAIVAATELHPDAPVRFDGWDADGNPVGRPVADPYIPLVAYTEEQTEELAYGALRVIIEQAMDQGRCESIFDVAMDRILRLDSRGRADGKAVALAGSPNARDGARTTFQHFDEPHRMYRPALVEAHRVMTENIGKRYLSDAWQLETGTSYQIGQHSVQESVHEKARLIAKGKVEDPTLFFFHRQAHEDTDVEDDDALREGIREASGPNIGWTDVRFIVGRFRDPEADIPYLRRVWLNQPWQGGGKAFPITTFRLLARDRSVPSDGVAITLGFDGSRYRDATGLVATEVASGWQWVLGCWEQDTNDEDWEVPEDEVEALLVEAFGRWDVKMLYPDPAYWHETVARWAGRWPKRVVEYPANHFKAVALAMRAYRAAMVAGELTHSGDERYCDHVENSYRKDMGFSDEDDEPLWIIEKERKHSPLKIDLTMAGCFSWAARLWAMKHGALETPPPAVLHATGGRRRR